MKMPSNKACSSDLNEREVHIDRQYDTAKVTLTTLEITHIFLVPCCILKAVVLAISVHWNGKHVWGACRTDKWLLSAYLVDLKSNSLPLQKPFSEAVCCDLPSLFQNSKTCQHISQYFIKTWYCSLIVYIYNFLNVSECNLHDYDVTRTLYTGLNEIHVLSDELLMMFYQCIEYSWITVLWYHHHAPIIIINVLIMSP